MTHVLEFSQNIYSKNKITAVLSKSIQCPLCIQRLVALMFQIVSAIQNAL